MEEVKTAQASDPAPQQEAPFGQRIFDNTFLLLALSLLISIITYNLWGLLETLNAPPLVP